MGNLGGTRVRDLFFRAFALGATLSLATAFWAVPNVAAQQGDIDEIIERCAQFEGDQAYAECLFFRAGILLPECRVNGDDLRCNFEFDVVDCGFDGEVCRDECGFEGELCFDECGFDGELCTTPTVAPTTTTAAPTTTTTTTSTTVAPTTTCLLYTSPSPRDATLSRMPSSA